MLDFSALVHLRLHCEPMFEHSVRTAVYAKLISDCLNMDEAFSTKCFEGGLFHDVGKSRIPRRYLFSKQKLDRMGFEAIKMHVKFGRDIAYNGRMPSHIADAISYHHEKFDGSGYPFGLKGNEIPLSVRIIAVADAFDAMTYKRSYGKLMDVGNAIAEIDRCAGVQFCPVVSAVVKNYSHFLEAGRLRLSMPEAIKDIDHKHIKEISAIVA